VAAPDKLDTLGHRLAAARREHGLTQQDIATAIGVTVRSVQNWEADRTAPRRHLARLALAVHRSPGWLLLGRETRSRTPAVAAALTEQIQLADELRERLATLEANMQRITDAMEQLRARRTFS
jgi:HTH-type transcriptional regulator, cell division transcriptional repressor